MNTPENILIPELLKLGATQHDAYCTYQVYLELAEVKRFFDLEYHFHEELNRLYLTAKLTKSSNSINTFIPISSNKCLSLSDIDKLINISNDNTATFAVVSPDSTCTYYDIIRGISDINLISRYKQILDKREQHDAQIKIKRPMIEQALNLRSAIPPITVQNENIDDLDIEVDQNPINHSRQWFAKNW